MIEQDQIMLGESAAKTDSEGSSSSQVKGEGQCVDAHVEQMHTLLVQQQGFQDDCGPSVPPLPPASAASALDSATLLREHHDAPGLRQTSESNPSPLQQQDQQQAWSIHHQAPHYVHGAQQLGHVEQVSIPQMQQLPPHPHGLDDQRQQHGEQSHAPDPHWLPLQQLNENTKDLMQFQLQLETMHQMLRQLLQQQQQQQQQLQQLQQQLLMQQQQPQQSVMEQQPPQPPPLHQKQPEQLQPLHLHRLQQQQQQQSQQLQKRQQSHLQPRSREDALADANSEQLLWTHVSHLTSEMDALNRHNLALSHMLQKVHGELATLCKVAQGDAATGPSPVMT